MFLLYKCMCVHVCVCMSVNVIDFEQWSTNSLVGRGRSNMSFVFYLLLEFNLQYELQLWEPFLPSTVDVLPSFQTIYHIHLKRPT